VTIYDLASEHLQDHGRSETEAAQILLEFGMLQGRDIPWGDEVPSIPRSWVERIDAYAASLSSTGWSEDDAAR
jgi:hypothetical protein